jgi:hypothetical protein
MLLPRKPVLTLLPKHVKPPPIKRVPIKPPLKPPLKPPRNVRPINLLPIKLASRKRKPKHVKPPPIKRVLMLLLKYLLLKCLL